MSASLVAHSFSLNPSAVKSTAANRNLSLFTLSQHRGPLHFIPGFHRGGSGGKKYTLAWTPFVEAEEEKYQSAEGWPYGDGPQ
jgi:hypothetical protein